MLKNSISEYTFFVIHRNWEKHNFRNSTVSHQKYRFFSVCDTLKTNK